MNPSDETLTVGGMCDGIGGISLGFERAGMRMLWHCEIDPYASAVLHEHWPTVPNLGDLTTIEWSTVDRPAVLVAGYPCQPFSLAGSRRGEADPRHLWPHVARAIRDLRPRVVVLENVPGHRSLGFDRVLGDLAESGHDAEWDGIPASAVGAHHRRDRLWVVAYPQRDPVRQEPLWIFGGGRPPEPGHDGLDRPLAHTESVTFGPGLRQDETTGLGRGRPGDCGGPPRTWAPEPDVGRVAHGVPARLDRLRGLGNAVVPQVAEAVARRVIAAVARGDL